MVEAMVKSKNITAPDIKNAMPRDKPWEMRDSGVTGLILKIRPTGVKTWTVRYTPTGGRRNNKKLGTYPAMTVAMARAQALKVLGQATAGADPGRDGKREKRATLGVYVRGQYAEYAQQNIASHDGTLKLLAANFGHLYGAPMTDISEMDVQRWRAKLAKQSSPVAFTTVQRRFTALKACLNTAQKTHKVITHHQLSGVTLKRTTAQLETADEKPPRFLTRKDEYPRLVAALNARQTRMRASGLPCMAGQYTDHLMPLVLVALHTGLRRGDLFSLEWSHINLERGQITKVINKTRRKTIKPVVLPLRNDAVAVLKDWRAQTSGNGLVFPSPVTGKQLDSVKTAWRNLMTAADIQGFRFHDLRHTFASWLVMAGVSLFTVQKLMTHSTAEMTQVYAHLSDDHLRQAIELPG
jgi:integrase